MTSLRWIAVVSLLLALPLAAAPARAEPGCYDDSGTCQPAVSLGPCDSTCPTGFCVSAACVEPSTCERPCGTGGECPPLRFGNNTVPAEGASGESCFYGTGCGGFTISADAFTTNDTSGRCLDAREVGIAAALHGDCDGDQVPLIAEGVGQICRQQSYVSPTVRANTPTCTGMCPSCVSGFSPHGGSVCATDEASAYACSGAAECPSTFDVPATGCIPYVAGGSFRSGACFYGHVCGDLAACFALDRADTPGPRWLEAAFLAGDCDMDGITNAEDPADCGVELVVWNATDPFVSPTRTGCMSSGLLCTIGDCSRLDVCAPDGAIGLACEPENMASTRYCSDQLGVEAECVVAGSAGADVGVGVCIPSEPADDSCGTRGRECFAVGVDPADSYHSGDCDGDGLVNGEDPDVCVRDESDAGPPAMDDAAVGREDAATGAEDAGSASSTDAGGLDAFAAEAVDAGEPGRFAGSGCSCRTHTSPSAPRGLALLGALGLVVGLRRRRRVRAR